MKRLAELDLAQGSPLGGASAMEYFLVVGIRDRCSATVVNRVQANH